MRIQSRLRLSPQRAEIQSVLDELAGASNDIAVFIIASRNCARGIHKRNTMTIKTLLHGSSERRSRANRRHPGSAGIL